MVTKYKDQSMASFFNFVMRETMKNIIYSLLITTMMASCGDAPEEYSDSDTNSSSSNKLHYIDISNARSVFISSSNSNSRSSSKEYGGKAEDKIFKITDAGIEEVKFLDSDNKTHTITKSPIAIDVVDEDYIIFSFGSSIDNPTSCYLTNKETGLVYQLGVSLHEDTSEAKCPLPQSNNSKDKKILTDNNSNLYYRSYGCGDGSCYIINKVNYSDPKNIVHEQITNKESVHNFVVDYKGNISYNELSWIGFDGEIKYNNTDVNLTSGYYKLYQEDKLILFDPMGNGKYLIDNGKELVTKELTKTLLISFLLEVKCKHTFECLTEK